MKNRNITLSLPEDVIRRVRIAAIHKDMSVSAFVGSLLQTSIGTFDENDDLWSREEAAMRSGALRIGATTWSRDDLHDRKP